MRLNRLVALCFIPNTENKPCVNHINGRKSDNNVGNLEWVTFKENTNHAIKTGLITFGCGVNCRRRNPVIQYDRFGNFIAEYISIKEGSIITGVNHGNIVRHLNGYYNCSHAGGFVWKRK